MMNITSLSNIWVVKQTIMRQRVKQLFGPWSVVSACITDQVAIENIRRAEM
jgi:hypothetical protein